jgi:hypothetical protein
MMPNGQVTMMPHMMPHAMQPRGPFPGMPMPMLMGQMGQMGQMGMGGQMGGQMGQMGGQMGGMQANKKSDPFDFLN